MVSQLNVLSFVSSDSPLRFCRIAAHNKPAVGFSTSTQTFKILWYNGKTRGSDLEKYRVHRFDVKMTSDAQALEDFLNGLRGDVVAIIPNVTSRQFEYASVDFLLIVEKTIS